MNSAFSIDEIVNAAGETVVTVETRSGQRRQDSNVYSLERSERVTGNDTIQVTNSTNDIDHKIFIFTCILFLFTFELRYCT